MEKRHGFQSQETVEELSGKGCYIHVISNALNKPAFDFDKMDQHHIPVPATHVGLAPVRVYDAYQWTDRSGIVLPPSTISLLSYKHDCWTNRLKVACNKNLGDFPQAHQSEEHYENYSTYLVTTLNSLSDNVRSSFIEHQTPKRIQVGNDLKFAFAKYREMKVRAGLAHLPAVPPIRDASSKYIVADLIKNVVITNPSIGKNELLKVLAQRSSQNRRLKDMLEHVIIKIQRFDEARLAQYLQRAATPPAKNKEEFYSTFIKKHSSTGLAPNEHLLLPKFDEIKGVYVNIKSVKGIDHAFEIKKELETRRKAKLNTTKIPYTYALIYQPSFTADLPMAQVGWSRALHPWSTQGLIEFATTGRVTTRDEQPPKSFVPNYFEIFSTTDRAHHTMQFVDDLSKVANSDGKNLLHLAIENGRSKDVIKFFCLWQVSPTRADHSGATPLWLAKQKNHPAIDLLSEVAYEWNESQREEEKDRFIMEHPNGPR
ncbi:MAG TPA: hypothetical protein VFS42_03680 [Burkholderiaceae bacterium]|nr:hypothetical protein [Burkholderiaceae bacterium]